MGKINNNMDPNWQIGDSATEASGGRYTEDLGREDGHLVVVNDTRISIDDTYHCTLQFHLTVNKTLTSLGWILVIMVSRG